MRMTVVSLARKITSYVKSKLPIMVRTNFGAYFQALRERHLRFKDDLVKALAHHFVCDDGKLGVLLDSDYKCTYNFDEKRVEGGDCETDFPFEFSCQLWVDHIVDDFVDIFYESAMKDDYSYGVVPELDWKINDDGEEERLGVRFEVRSFHHISSYPGFLGKRMRVSPGGLTIDEFAMEALELSRFGVWINDPRRDMLCDAFHYHSPYVKVSLRGDSSLRNKEAVRLEQKAPCTHRHIYSADGSSQIECSSLELQLREGLGNTPLGADEHTPAVFARAERLREMANLMFNEDLSNCNAYMQDKSQHGSPCLDKDTQNIRRRHESQEENPDGGRADDGGGGSGSGEGGSEGIVASMVASIASALHRAFSAPASS